MKKLLDADGGVTKTFHYDETTDTSFVKSEQDVEPILESNKSLQLEGDGYTPSRDMKRIASIPLVIAEQWMKADGINWMALGKKEKAAYLRKKLNDPDNRFLRTSPGRF